MHIFIDESGIFGNPQGRENLASVVAALVIPSTQRKTILKKFKRLTRSWFPKDHEIKGRELDEDRIASIIRLLNRYDVCVQVTVMDLGLHTNDEITAFKERQANNITANLTPEHQPTLVEQATQVREIFLKMSNPIFVQAMLTMILIPRLVTKMAHYYARRIPKELANFHWVVDAKDKKLTEFEKAWSKAIYPVMSTQSLKEPFARIEGGDYSFLDAFNVEDPKQIESTRRWFERENPNLRGESITAVSLAKLLGQSFRFGNSAHDKGLQLVDVVANATQRAFNGKLREEGWRGIGSLMIAQNPSPVDFISFNTGSDEPASKVIKSPFYRVIDTFKQDAKMLWTDADAPDFQSRRR